MKYVAVMAILFTGLFSNRHNLSADQPNGEPWSEDESMEYFFHEPIENMFEAVGKPSSFVDEFDELHETRWEQEEGYEEHEEPWFRFWEHSIL